MPKGKIKKKLDTFMKSLKRHYPFLLKRGIIEKDKPIDGYVCFSCGSRDQTRQYKIIHHKYSKTQGYDYYVCHKCFNRDVHLSMSQFLTMLADGDECNTTLAYIKKMDVLRNEYRLKPIYDRDNGVMVFTEVDENEMVEYTDNYNVFYSNVLPTHIPLLKLTERFPDNFTIGDIFCFNCGCTLPKKEKHIYINKIISEREVNNLALEINDMKITNFNKIALCKHCNADYEYMEMVDFLSSYMDVKVETIKEYFLYMAIIRDLHKKYRQMDPMSSFDKVFNYWQKIFNLPDVKRTKTRTIYSCFKCGSKKDIQRAHINAKFWSEDNRPENIHLLCNSCHMKSEFINGDQYWKWFMNNNRQINREKYIEKSTIS